MKLVLVLLSVACAALAAPSQYEPIALNYHESYGIPEARRIKQLEDALDFDGGRITGGTAARAGQYPHLGGLVITLHSGGTSVCGSSLLSNTRLVTAAHCWFDGQNNARQLTVVLGSERLFTGGLRVLTNRVQIHAQYNHRNLNNDIAIITINWINYSTTVNRIVFATGTNQFTGQIAAASGYGRTSDSANISQNQVISHVTMPVISVVDCQRVFGPATVISSTLCTNTVGGRSTCHGDSGGPLDVGNTLVGVTSFVANAGCTRGLPAGFARVTSFASWIQARM